MVLVREGQPGRQSPGFPAGQRMPKAGLVQHKFSQSVLLNIRKDPLRISSLMMALYAGKAALKCALRDMERLGG